MTERTHLLPRVVSVIAATFISLACGTNVSSCRRLQKLITGDSDLISLLVCLFGLGPSIRRADEVFIHSEQLDRQSRLE